MEVAFPFRLDQSGRVASTHEYDRHIVELIEQVLFTAPGERPNRPDFGCGLLLLVFQPEDSQFAVATSTMIQAALSRTLGSLIRLLGVDGETSNSELLVTIRYTVIRTGATHTATFRRQL